MLRRVKKKSLVTRVVTFGSLRYMFSSKLIDSVEVGNSQRCRENHEKSGYDHFHDRLTVAPSLLVWLSDSLDRSKRRRQSQLSFNPSSITRDDCSL